MTDTEKVEEQAAQWVAREDRGITPAEEAALASWLNQSTANRVAYLRLRASWGNTVRLAALRHSMTFSDRPMSRQLLFGVAGVMALALFVFVGDRVLTFQRATSPAVYATNSINRHVLRLNDGSRIQLNTNTRLKTDLTDSTRSVTLERGEAYFEVVHEDRRPFVVMAGNRKITDLGTKFSVRRDGDDVRVLVTEGKVRIEDINAIAQAAPVVAVGGDVVMAKADETLVAATTAQEISNELGWRSEMLTFNQITLADAAEQFNRYNSKQIVVTGGARNIRIGGSFRSDNIDAFASLVRNALRLKVTSNAKEITISQ